MGLGATVGLLNGIWAATAVVGPLAAGGVAEHLSARVAFALTGISCIATLCLAAATSRTRTQAARRGGPAVALVPLDSACQDSACQDSACQDSACVDGARQDSPRQDSPRQDSPRRDSACA
jgi:hypothetical protein